MIEIFMEGDRREEGFNCHGRGWNRGGRGREEVILTLIEGDRGRRWFKFVIDGEEEGFPIVKEGEKRARRSSREGAMIFIENNRKDKDFF